MKLQPVVALPVTLALAMVLVFPLAADAHPGNPGLPVDGALATTLDPRTSRWPQPTAAGDYAIYVRASGTYPDDGIVIPVLEALEARYAAANREFTVEYWFKLRSGYDSNGKELFDHHVPSNEGFWTAFQNGKLWAGIDTKPASDNTAIHVRTGSGFNDEKWHHYALVRDLNASPDRLCLYLDGVGTCYADGSNSQWAHVYEDIRPSDNRDGDDGNNYPFYVIGARTSGAGEIEAWIDELRISAVARYRNNFTPSSAPFVLDANTVMLFHFNEGTGNTTVGRDGSNNPIQGTLVRDLGWYGIGATPLDPGNPTESIWLGQMWASGRFGGSSPSLTLTSPAGSVLWKTGAPYEIRWTWSGTTTHASLSYSTDGFVAVKQTIVTSTLNDGAYTWTTPVTPSTTTRVRVADTGNPAIYDDSDADFILTDNIYFAYLPLILKDMS